MELLDFPRAYSEIRRMQDTDEPTSKAEASAVAKTVIAAVEPLLDWARTFADTLEDLTSKAEELQEADTGERSDCHEELSATAGQVLDELVELGVDGDTVMALLASRSAR